VLAHGGLGVGVLHVPETAMGTSVYRVALSRSYPADWLLAGRGKAAVDHYAWVTYGGIWSCSCLTEGRSSPPTEDDELAAIPCE
jgi:hypothetical protein